MIEINKKYAPIAESDGRYFIVTGGRGSGKSFSINLLLVLLTYEAGHTILFTRYTLSSTYISIIPEFIEKLELLKIFDDFHITKDEIRNKIFNEIQEGLIELPPGEDAYTLARQLSGKEVNKLQKKLIRKGELNYSFSHFDLYVEIFYKKIRKIDYPKNKWLNINKYSNSQLPTVMKKILEIMM